MTDTVLVLEEFLAPAELGMLWTYAMQREAQFVASQVVNDDSNGHSDDDVRRSSVLYDIDPIYPLISQRVMEQFAHIVRRLDMAWFDVREIELQVTSSNDGEWFKAHRDSGHGAVQTRELTFIYYCHREPRAFSGGELGIFGAFAQADGATAPRRVHEIVPAQNSLVAFPSHYLHEVAPVSCPSRRFADSRLTYNGWLHR